MVKMISVPKAAKIFHFDDDLGMFSTKTGDNRREFGGPEVGLTSL